MIVEYRLVYSYDSYTPSIVSVTVENAAPTNFVCVFDKIMYDGMPSIDSLSIPGLTISNVSKTGDYEITIVTTTPALFATSYTLTYTKPSSILLGHLESEYNYYVNSFSKIVVNYVTGVSNPSLVPPILIENATPTKIKIPYDLALNETSIPAVGSYVLGSGRTVTLVEVSGLFVYLTASARYYWGDTETVAYTKPGTDMIKSTTGGEADSFTAQTVTNNVALDTYANALINRMIAASETPTATHQYSINKCIVDLRTANLFETRFDGYVVTRGYGLVSTKINWISDLNNATGVNTPTYADNVGYSVRAGIAYLDTNFNPSTASKLTQNNASFIFKVGGTRSTANYYTGAYHATNGGIYMGAGATQDGACNGLSASYGLRWDIGYNAIVRDDATKVNFYVNTAQKEVANNSKAPINANLYMLRINFTSSYFFPDTAKLEFYGFGAHITQAEFNTIQTIMNTYFASL